VIPVAPQPEPSDFAVKVRLPGESYLRQNAKPNSNGFDKHGYWRSCLADLCLSYGGICAYSSLWLPSEISVDHFKPKSSYPALAYEWSNYRLASRRVNKNKGDSEDVLDPFAVVLGWFVLDLATLRVNPEGSLDHQVKRSVQRTIDILKLNDEPFVRARFGLVRDYLDGLLTLEFLKRKYPFVAVEIMRQGV
jgi:hypothetical protein